MDINGCIMTLGCSPSRTQMDGPGTHFVYLAVQHDNFVVINSDNFNWSIAPIQFLFMVIWGMVIYYCLNHITSSTSLVWEVRPWNGRIYLNRISGPLQL